MLNRIFFNPYLNQCSSNVHDEKTKCLSTITNAINFKTSRTKSFHNLWYNKKRKKTKCEKTHI